MTPTSVSAIRRSQRVVRMFPVVVCGESRNRNSFREEALTISFNAHGALLMLYVKLELRQELLVMNPTTWDEQQASVIHFSPSYGGLSHVGIEFVHPAPGFWPLKNPPDDWQIASIVA
jgi:hypothetical protein